MGSKQLEFSDYEQSTAKKTYQAPGISVRDGQCVAADSTELPPVNSVGGRVQVKSGLSILRSPRNCSFRANRKVGASFWARCPEIP